MNPQITPEVAQAIEEIKTAFSGHDSEVVPEAQGGAYVVIEGLFLGEQYVPTRSWIGFLISFQYPAADIYPHFLDGALRREDGNPLGEGFSGPIPWQDRQAIQVSRRSNRWSPATDTAVLKLAKVLEWIKSR